MDSLQAVQLLKDVHSLSREMSWVSLLLFILVIIVAFKKMS